MSKKGIQIEVNHLDEKKKSSLRNRLIVAGVLAVICLPCLFLGGWFWFALISVVLCISIYEVIHVTRKKYKWYVYAFTYLIVLSLVYWVFLKTNLMAYKDNPNDFVWLLEERFSHISFSLYLLAPAFGGYALMALFSKDFTWNDVIYLFTMCVVLGIGFQCIFFIRYYPAAYSHPELTWQAGIDKTSAAFKYGQSVLFAIFIIGGTMFNDVWAYFVGIFFGKHKMLPNISPNKTWEGFFGGWILGGLSCFAMALICDSCGLMILPSYQIFTSNTQWWWIVILSMLIPLFGDLGDFTFSLIKRHYQIKDYSHVLGAHGGFLDRLDSIFFTTVFATIFTIFVSGGWNFLQ